MLVAAIALVAGGTVDVALVLALAMLGIQFSIGVANDLLDEPTDRIGRPSKPLVRGAVSRTTAIRLAVGLGTAGILLATTQGLVELGLLATMYACGLSYDLGLKGRGFGWLAYAIAFPLLPAYAWFGATEGWPPRYELLLPIAALAGPALALSNGLVDHDRDGTAGERTLVVRLGRPRALLVMAGLLAVVHAVAWLTAGAAPIWLLCTLGSATALAAAGGALSARQDAESREWGWRTQAVALAILASGWFVAAAQAGRAPG